MVAAGKSIAEELFGAEVALGNGELDSCGLDGSGVPGEKCMS
jgi:hypothetical protein